MDYVIDVFIFNKNENGITKQKFMCTMYGAIADRSLVQSDSSFVWRSIYTSLIHVSAGIAFVIFFIYNYC